MRASNAAAILPTVSLLAAVPFTVTLLNKLMPGLTVLIPVIELAGVNVESKLVMLIKLPFVYVLTTV